ncbi:MAG TPA: ribose 5-phosphate isomerase B [Flavobacteriales bacterium]|nr:ribose 5-phosphate isomerase B [Flavobacteriales bacterium]
MKHTIDIGCDHAGVDLKQVIIKHLESKGFKVNNHGTNTSDSVDYPDFAHSVSKAVVADGTHIGILICGSGNGINMTANKYAQIRSALCWTAEIAKLARQHNNANIIALPARFIETNEALKAVDAFLETEFEGGRHANRVNKIAC